ncbi:hypothetical protein SETIT_2G001200v2 [Setaria italica]|uniref:Uncharacterized protein n=1 Tax=Setaria italica TaxID=4555 RepID=K3ZS49_SETIT|nr:serine/arginine repetitive matrix protein 2 [Setaria italica]RCV09126.1 hypothetical protein SETIT_2G001200v2 [Setaria italica]
MKTKASASKNAAGKDEAKPKKIRSSRNHRHRRNHSSSSGSESPPRKRSKKHSKRVADKKSRRSKVSSSSRRRRRRSLSPSHSLSSSSSPSSIARHHSTCSGSASESLESPPPRSQSRDVHKKKGRGRDRERDRKRRKARRSASSSSTSASSGSSRSRSKSKHRKRRTDAGTTRDKIEIDYDNRHASRSEKNMAEDDDRDEEALTVIAKKRDGDIDSYKKNLELESQHSKKANQTQDMEPAGGGNSDAEDLELILRQKALENFRKFRAAAAGKTDTNGATGKEALIDGSQNTGTEIAEARSSAVNHFQWQGSSLVMKNSAGSPRSEDCGNATSHSWKQEGSAGMSHGAASPGILEAGEIGGATQQKGRTVEATHSNCQFRSPQDGRNSLSVMQRLESMPGSCAGVLGSSAGVSHVNGAPRVRSVVSIPAREGLDGSTYTTPPRPSENSAPVESSSDIGRPLIDINKAERTNGDGRKTSEASASNGSILSPAEGKSQIRTEDKDGAQFQKKTFSRMHDGETVEVSYKVYIPKKTPALARRKLQR